MPGVVRAAEDRRHRRNRPLPKRPPWSSEFFAMDTPGGASRAASDCGLGLEGIVKRIRSRYVSGRTRAWLKTKNPDFERR